ncbi:MAG TPA: cyclic 2,3-diphosphoglycerate synthase [Geobacteraceae bacterium]|nr:cyclic 2,3-diphosphoglycerate synthase [Geobacteraceae bacterium]
MRRERVLIMGAAGRDFHNFNVCFRDAPGVRVVAFTATQIPFITERRYPPALAGKLYPRGIPIYDESRLTELIARLRVDRVIFSYSDISHADLMHRASLVLASGADFSLLGPVSTMLKSRKPVISVCAVRTGCGKSQVSRYLCDVVRSADLAPVVVRHPMPYGDLSRQAVERFGHFEDLSLHRCTIEEREEYEPLLLHGAIVYAGVDYGKVLQRAEREGDVLIWDGGNNDFSFFVPDLEIVLVDPLRAGHETGFFPGEVNLRRASIVVINKSNTVVRAVCDRMEETVRSVNPAATVIRTESLVRLADQDAAAGRRVLVVEDGPSITHGGLASGAGYAAAIRFGAGEIIDPRPYAVGTLAETYRTYPHISRVLPAMGYRDRQMEDLRRTIDETPCDLIVSATPIDLRRLLPLSKPVVRAFYDINEEEGEPLKRIVLQFLSEKGH